ncbi:MAG: SGNH/GDSL hydrolase family protein [Eubacteriales bacterium]|nr:SGNH/GDSL hydrolase family protein [Eubacteriales bacterium]
MISTSKTIVCFGDSNTHGYNSFTKGRFTETQRWTCLLDRYLPENYLIREEGLSGRTTAFSDPLFEGLDGLSYLFPCLMSHEPVDLLIIMLGTNDTKERFSATPENIAKGLERLLQKAISADAWRTAPNILVIAPPPIEEGYESSDVGGEMGKGCMEKSQRLAPLFQASAARFGCHFLDAGSIDGICMYPYDHMHLSEDSHRILAEKLAELIPRITP